MARDSVGEIALDLSLNSNGFKKQLSGIADMAKKAGGYCQSRQNRSVAAPIYNRGLICVRRGLPEDDSDRRINAWKEKRTDLYVTQLGRMLDEAGLAFWQAQLAGGKSWDEVSAAVIDSDEGQRRSKFQKSTQKRVFPNQYFKIV